MRKLQVKGSFFLKDKGRFFKVITVRPVGDNRYVFGCRELDSKKSEVLTFRLLGLLDAMKAAASMMRTRKTSCWWIWTIRANGKSSPKIKWTKLRSVINY